MASIKKYNGSTFVDAAIRKYSTASEIITPPTTIYADGSNITTYTIKGNTVQNGTPTPSAPIAVQGVGELDSGQYKIPIINNDVTTPLYLESTVSNRLIKKLVLDGTEDLTLSSTDANRTVCYLTNLGCANALCLCTHIEGKLSYSSNEYNRILTYTNFNGVLYISIEKGLVGSTLETFKAYLAAQYTADTPVTVYYVLSTAETAAVNEPLMKIGAYADTLSNAASIPTTEGANSISVDTTVQPSEFTATWTGWHDASAKEWDGSQWQ